MNDNVNARAFARQGLVNRIVHHFIHEVMQSLHVRAAHVHARAASHGLEAFEYLNVVCFVFTVGLSHISLQKNWVRFISVEPCSVLRVPKGETFKRNTQHATRLSLN